MYKYTDVNEIVEVSKVLSSDRNLHFVISHGIEFAGVGEALVRMLLKKALLYANKTIIVTGEMDDVYLDGEYKVTREIGVCESLKQVLMEFTSNELFNETIFVLPDTIGHVWKETGDSSEEPGQFSTVYEFSSAYKNDLSVMLSTRDPSLALNIYERPTSNDLSVLNIWLPFLSNVPIDLLLRLRQDNADSFSQFQHAIKRLLKETEGLDSDSKIKELFQHVDYEVRAFQNRILEIKRGRFSMAADVVITALVAGLYFYLPSEQAMLISSFIGANSARDFVQNLFKERRALHDLKASDFYLPWLCSKFSKESKSP